MKFPVPKTLRGAVSPTILINWAFGLGVFEYPMGRPRPIISAVWSMINFIMYLGFVSMANLSEMTQVQGSKIAANNYRINVYVISSFIAISMCLSQTRTKMIKNSLIGIIGLNERLKILGIPNDYDLIFKAQIIQLSAAFVYIFTLMVLDFNFFGSDFPTETSRIGFCLTFHYMLMFTAVVDFSFNVNISYFQNRFQRLNALLVESNSLERRGPTNTETSNNKFPLYPSVIKEIDRYNPLAIRAASSQWLLHVVRETRKIHWSLCKAVTTINRAYGVQLLFSVALFFGVIITLLYRFYISTMTLASRFNSTPNDWRLAVVAIMWIIFYVIKVFWVVGACETTTHEANRTGELVAKLLITTPCDENIRDEMNIFLLQLVQNPLKFTAGGFFPLNYALIRGMVGTLTTYLVIMIQMQGIEDPEMVNFKDNSTMLV